MEKGDTSGPVSGAEYILKDPDGGICGFRNGYAVEYFSAGLGFSSL